MDLADHIQRSIYLRNCEALETRYLQKLVKPGWVAVDAGANIGYYSLLFSKLVGPRGIVYAFEPSEDNWKNLSKTITLNSPTNLRAFKLALSDVCGKTAIVAGPPGSLGKARLDSIGLQGSSSADQVTLDSFAAQNAIARLDVMKVDIEGCEERLLIGAAKTIERFRPVLLIELNPQALDAFRTTAENLIARLRRHGYQLFRLTWLGLKPFHRLEREVEFINIIATPEGR